MTPYYEILHWLPVKMVIDLKVLLLSFKATHGFADTQDFVHSIPSCSLIISINTFKYHHLYYY